MNNINNILEIHTPKVNKVKETKIDYLTILKNFTKELLTSKNSSPIKIDYGTNFISKLGNIVNIYKIRYYLEEEIESIKDKYKLQEVEVVEAYQEKDMLVVKLNAIFNDGYKHNTYLQVDWRSKQFTTREIVEEAD